MPFTPQITIGDSKINPGQKVWVWKLPGLQEEIYGAVGAMSFDVTRKEYVRRLNRNPHYNFKESDVPHPEMTARTNGAPVPEAASNIPLCGCGAPFGHRGMCSHRRKQWEERNGKPYPITHRGRKKSAEQSVPEPAQTDPKPAGSHGATVQLGGSQRITLTVSGDAFALSKADREFVFGLLDMMEEYRKKL
jgi:hypothetical protein